MCQARVAPGERTWHFSSRLQRRVRREDGVHLGQGRIGFEQGGQIVERDGLKALDAQKEEIGVRVVSKETGGHMLDGAFQTRTFLCAQVVKEVGQGVSLLEGNGGPENMITQIAGQPRLLRVAHRQQLVGQGQGGRQGQLIQAVQDAEYPVDRPGRWILQILAKHPGCQVRCDTRQDFRARTGHPRRPVIPARGHRRGEGRPAGFGKFPQENRERVEVTGFDPAFKDGVGKPQAEQPFARFRVGRQIAVIVDSPIDHDRVIECGSGACQAGVVHQRGGFLNGEERATGRRCW